MGNVKVVPRSLTDAYKRREGDFAPNLVGLQFTNGSSLFTFGNFEITTNLDKRLAKDFALGGQWSEYYSLDNLNLTQSQSTILESNDINIRLNFDINKIDRYVYFGSFYEYSKVTVEQIIQKWRGSVYLNPTSKTNLPVNTVLSFSYNSSNDTSTFLIPKTVITNNYELIVDQNIDFGNLLPEDIFNLSRDYDKYVIWSNNKNYDVIGYTGSTESYQYMNVTTKGNPFPGLSGYTFGQLTYHLKPNDTEVELFFAQLEDFEKIILNRLTTPIYSSSFSVPFDVDGFIVFGNKTITWPITDGYNLDINTNDYGKFISNLLDMSTAFDLYKTNLVSRRFVSESIHEYDTDGGEEIYGKKVSKLLKIYGREFDQVKKYIDGISFANVVTYNKLDNTSDELIKIMASTLGFDVLLTVGTNNFNLTEQNQPNYDTVFSGYSRSLTSKELDVELWRRLVINAWWLWKSKGTRKVIEFFFSLFNIPQCLISLDEYVYLVEERLDVLKVYNQILEIYNLKGLDTESVTLDGLPIDDYGFPRILPETNQNYFQMDGFWYNGGNESRNGNNPHIGPYDSYKYFRQFECFVSVDDVITGSTTLNLRTNHFNSYNNGSFAVNEDGSLPLPLYGTTYANTLNDNGSTVNAVIESAGLVYFDGTPNAPRYQRTSSNPYSMKISFNTSNGLICDPCNLNYKLGEDGLVYVVGNPSTLLTDQKCCEYYWLPSKITTQSTQVCDIGPKTIMVDVSCVIKNIKTRTPIDRICCRTMSSMPGTNVYWDGQYCIDKNCSGTKPPQSIETQYIEEISSGSLFTEQVTTNNCYWCPPDGYTRTVCDPTEFLENLTETQIIQLAFTYGGTTERGESLSFKASLVYLEDILVKFFREVGCIILDSSNQQITNRECCKLKGGTAIETKGGIVCTFKPVDPCSENYLANHVFTFNNGQNILDETCCKTIGKNWSDGYVYSYTPGYEEFEDSVGLSYANSFGLKSYCTDCPTYVTYVEDCTSTCALVVKDDNNVNLTEKCCNDYGFSYDSIKRCLLCSKTVNASSTSPYLVTNLNNTDLSLGCCQSSGYYYNFNDDRCYQCSSEMTDYTIVGGEVLFNGNSLSSTCCENYDIVNQGNDVSYQNGKCLIVVPLPQLVACRYTQPESLEWINLQQQLATLGNSDASQYIDNYGGLLKYTSRVVIQSIKINGGNNLLQNPINIITSVTQPLTVINNNYTNIIDKLNQQFALNTETVNFKAQLSFVSRMGTGYKPEFYIIRPDTIPFEIVMTTYQYNGISLVENYSLVYTDTDMYVDGTVPFNINNVQYGDIDNSLGNIGCDNINVNQITGNVVEPYHLQIIDYNGNLYN